MTEIDFILQSFKSTYFDFIHPIFSMAFDKNALSQLPTPVYLFWLALFLFVALMSLFQNYRHLLKARIIEDTPSSKIRSAAQGYSELTGKQYTLPNHALLLAPLSLKPCTWYSYKIYRKNQKNNWPIVAQGQSVESFMLNDLSDICIVDPTGADIHPNILETWYGFSANPQGKSKYKIMLFLGFLFGRYQYKEWRMDIGSPIYVLGNFSTLKKNEGSIINLISKTGLTARQPYLISNFTQLQLAKKYRLQSIFWLVLFLISMPYSLWWLSLKI